MFPIFNQYRQEDLTKSLRKKNKNIEKCGLALYAKTQENQWYIDNGFSKHMTRDKINF
jgi:hypothetical protein